MDAFIKSAIEDNPIGFRDEIHGVLSKKINDAIELKKIEFAQNYISGTSEEYDDGEEDNNEE